MMSDTTMKIGGFFTVECFGEDGQRKWKDEVHNLVVNQGLQHVLDVLFAGGAQINPWYIGLTDGSPTPAAGDTLASHAGWTEFDEYSDDRKEFVDVRSGQVVSNTASRASFSINASGTVGGAFLAAAATGTSAVLLSVTALTGGDRSVANGDTVQVTYTFSATDDGA